MDVLTLKHGWYPDDINSKLNFDEFAKEDSRELLLIGIPCTSEPQVIEHLKYFERTVYINLEHPCTLYGGSNELGLGPIQQQALFNEIYTICPYTATWLNNLDVGVRAVKMPYMHNLCFNTYADTEKTHAVAYCGLIHDAEIASYIETAAAHKYIFTTITPYNRNHSVDHLATHDNVDNVSKWGILAHSQTAIIQNNLYLKEEQINNVKQVARWSENEAFSHLDAGLLPQLKSRTVESALCKALMLVKKDPWNVIEHWFTEGKDFLYFEDCADLHEKIHEISTNWEQYIPVVESAYNKVVSYYNTNYIFKRIQEGKEIL